MLSLAMNAGVMTTNLKAEFPGYGTLWFDPQAMTNVLSFGNIAKRCPIQYLQQLDMFQVQLSNQINIFGYEQIDNLYALKGSQPRGEATKTPLTQAIVSILQATSHVQTINENSKFLTPKEIA